MKLSKFPSPCGVNIVAKIIFNVCRLALLVRRVSVPLRGKYRGEESYLMGITISRHGSFPSPCGVNIVAKWNFASKLYKILTDEFPSPCGVNIVAKIF